MRRGITVPAVARRAAGTLTRPGRSRIAVLACALLAVLPAVCADPPGIITIHETSVFVSPTRSAVRFTHADHQSLNGVTCLTCHHQFKDGENVLDPSTLVEGDPSTRCASCHSTPRELQKAFHGTCITCHDAEKRAGKVTGPRTCGECHPWKG